MTPDSYPHPQTAHEAFVQAAHLFEDRRLWDWCNNVASSDATTEAYMAAARALEDLRRNLAHDIAAQEARA